MALIVWFKRDLRPADHPALARAAGIAAETGAAVLPLYIVEPEYWRLPDTSHRQWEATREALEGLRADLAALGAPLVVRTGAAEAVLAQIARTHGVTRILAHEETGNLWTYARDRRVRAWARRAGIALEELPQSGVVRRLASRDGWAARRDAFVAAPVLAAPVALRPMPGIEPGALPPARALGLAPDGCRHRQPGGRAAGLALLESFLSERGEHYRKGMSSPGRAARVCSRLSPHLALGTVSVREAAQATAARAAARPGGAWGGSLSSFAARLAWRDHFAQKLEDAPKIETRCLHPATEALRPREPDAARLAAWSAGETGLPFVDACLRCLRATGWINFRMRAMLVAVASYHLWLDWRATGPVLARLFTDYDPGIHWPQMQMQSGTTGINTIRIYNPVKQGLDHDPDGRFTRLWLPELAEVPDAVLQMPWRWGGAGALLGARYPAPIVDPDAAARAAREAVWGQRRAEGFDRIAAGIVARHASRSERSGRFPNDRAPRQRRRVAPDNQLSFDL